MAELTKESAKQIIGSRKQVSGPGKYQLKVTSATNYTREDGTPVKILNFNAMTAYHVSQAVAAIKEKDWTKATNQALSATQRLGVDFIPEKGEIVDVIVEERVIKSGPEAGNLGLFVTAVQALKTSAATAVNLNSLFDEEEGAENEPDVAGGMQPNAEFDNQNEGAEGAESELVEDPAAEPTIA